MEHDPATVCAIDIDGAPEAGLGVRTLCVGRGALASLGMETVFISAFAASILHKSAPNGSRVIYRFRITARPGWLQPLVYPMFHRETRLRLESLKRFIESVGS